MPDLLKEATPWRWDRGGHFWYTEDGKNEMSPAECLEKLLATQARLLQVERAAKAALWLMGNDVDRAKIGLMPLSSLRTVDALRRLMGG